MASAISSSASRERSSWATPTPQDADLFVEKSPDNGRALVAALLDLGFPLTDDQRAEIVRGKDFVQLRVGPFDLDLVFVPDGIESFDEADRRGLTVEGMRAARKRPAA